ncbi:dTDP-4-dehydrorhamnose reductase (plasmid) [Sulfitobacter sp. W027]|uniref:dTDP-4-dehydrorhamnose reductase n=1 Tax=Sulfitobacter sp. W027 TaxID=2867025 RepID=UPI0021A72BA6|nr:dTDP-4-dehydrorhamnose reductase [Sulfitobacter sp. W027]UWR35839.1 dTDP-4-dehydrorhamnose reductase [Sulfitobacter sp. W027]UWR35857.1 dTDP-4-dehydrorhamnose reductase [Sulfitobacter sp. W027]
MILVFGKTGQIATELQLQADVTALDRHAADLSDPASCAAAIREHRPDVVINAAAYTAVDRAEEEPDLAQMINAQAPAAMAQACADLGIPFLHVSTDYVFDGSGTDPWQVNDPIAPLSVYGRTKAAGEEAVREAGGAYAILRTSWVFSAHGNNFVKTMLRLSETRDALSVVDDQIGGPTPAAGIAAALLDMARAMRTGQSGGTYHYAGTPSTSWKCFARETFAAAGRKVDVTGIPTCDYPTPATRPLNSRLDCSALESDFGISPPIWKANLAQIVRKLLL